MNIETMCREFRYDGLRLPDPNAKLSVDEVRTAFSATYPEICRRRVRRCLLKGCEQRFHPRRALQRALPGGSAEMVAVEGPATIPGHEDGQAETERA